MIGHIFNPISAYFRPFRNALLLGAVAVLRSQRSAISLARVVSSHHEYGAGVLNSQATHKSTIWRSRWCHVVRQPSGFRRDLLGFRDDF
jgi:hypothetical protein